MTFNPIQDTSSFYFHIENIDDSDQRKVSIKWGDRTITIVSPVLDQADKHMSDMGEDHFAGDKELVVLKLKEGTTVYLDLTRITQDDKGTPTDEPLRTFTERLIRRIGAEKETTAECERKFIPELESWVNAPEITADEKKIRQEGQKRILECHMTQLTTLDLSYNAFTTLPECIGRLSQLTRLDLSGNKLEALPESIGRLTQLTRLDLSDNAFTTLPECIGLLTQLTTLNLNNNRLESLPESIGQLTQLTTLNLSSNRLEALPESIGQLAQLTTLYLFNTRLESLPESIGQLAQLTTLYLSSNRLEALPESIGQLAQLTTLNLSSNRLEALPESIGQLTQLTTLILSYNNLRSLPLSVLDLPPTCTVEIRGHAFSNGVLAQLQQEIDARGANCPTIDFDMPPPRDASNPPSVEVSFQKLFQLADRTIDDISFFKGHDKPYALWFNHLLQTSDFTRGSDKTKKILANIVLNCFEYAAQDPNFFDVFANFSFENFIEFSTESCVDRLTLSLNDLEMFVELSKILKEQPTEIETIHLLKNVWASYQLTQIAAEKYQTLKLRDEIEVHLAYLTQCKEGLAKEDIHLPFTSSGMMFLSCSGVSPEEIAAATATVTTQFNDHRAFVDFLYDEGNLKSRASFAVFESMKTSWEKSEDFKKIVERQEDIEVNHELNGGQLIAAYDAIKEEKRDFYAEKIDAKLNP